MRTGAVHVNGRLLSKMNFDPRAGDLSVDFNPPIVLKDGDALSVTLTMENGVVTNVGSALVEEVDPDTRLLRKVTWSSTATGGGTWITSAAKDDMTDWPPNDIIDFYAEDLAKRHPA